MIARTPEAETELARAVVDIAHELACAPGSTPARPAEAFRVSAPWVPNFVGGWEKALRLPSEDGAEAYDVVVGGGFDEDDGTTFANVHVVGTDAGMTWFISPGTMAIVEEHAWSEAEPLPVWIGEIVRGVVDLVASSRRRTKLA
jgi:hypothetical protein